MVKHDKKKVGSSETTREASVFNFDIVQSFYCTCKKKTSCTTSEKKDKRVFLEWFVGFTEGDGSFALAIFPTISNPYNMRPSFQITQKHPQVLYRIKKELGFGTIVSITDRKTCRSYYRFSVYKLEHVRHLILLFNGNLVIEKVQIRFAQWVKTYNDLCDQRDKLISENLTKTVREPCIGLQESHYLAQQSSLTKVLLNLFTPQIDLDSAWLAGFTDAEGGFYGSLSPSKRHLTGFRERYKFYIPQKDGLEVLQRIAHLVQTATFGKKALSSTNLVAEIPGKPNVYRLEISRLSSLEVLVEYLTRYPLLSKKQLVFVRWRRILLRRDALKAQAVLSEKGMRRYKRMYGSIGKIREATETNLV